MLSDGRLGKLAHANRGASREADQPATAGSSELFSIGLCWSRISVFKRDSSLLLAVKCPTYLQASCRPARSKACVAGFQNAISPSICFQHSLFKERFGAIKKRKCPTLLYDSEIDN